MGNQIGPIHLSGKIGGFVFYIDADGKPRFRKAAAPSRDKIKKDANFALTRKGNDEFTGASLGAMGVRMCGGESIRRFADRHLGARLMGKCRSMIKAGPGQLGQRRLEVVATADRLRNLEFHKGISLTGQFQSPFTVTSNPDRNTATLDVPSFNPNVRLRPPYGATHFRLHLVAGVLSDCAYVGGEQVYAPVHEDLHGVSVTAVSAAMPVSGALTPVVQLVASLPGSPLVPVTAGLVVSVGIEFHQTVNNFEETMAEGNALRIVEVF